MAKSLGIKQATLNAQSTANGGMPPEEASMFQNTTKKLKKHTEHMCSHICIYYSLCISQKLKKRRQEKSKELQNIKYGQRQDVYISQSPCLSSSSGSRGGDGGSQSRILLLLHKAICRRQHGAYHMTNIVYAPTVANYIS